MAVVRSVQPRFPAAGLPISKVKSPPVLSCRASPLETLSVSPKIFGCPVRLLSDCRDAHVGTAALGCPVEPSSTASSPEPASRLESGLQRRAFMRTILAVSSSLILLLLSSCSPRDYLTRRLASDL